MPSYEYGRITCFAANLEKAGIAEDIRANILQGGEVILRSTSPKAKAAWLGEAMTRMDNLLDLETRRAVREACACCLGGKREKLTKAIAKQGGTLEERVQACNETPTVFGHSVTLQADGRIRVMFWPEGLEYHRCPCLPKAAQPLPISYCYCCGGHVKHHLQTALGRKLSCEVVTSALSTGGTEPCTFVLTLVD
jgi:hypothetical protein